MCPNLHAATLSAADNTAELAAVPFASPDYPTQAITEIT